MLTDTASLAQPGIAVAGLGKMGTMHVAMIRAQPGGRVVALVDADHALTRQVESMGAFGESGGKTFDQLEKCLDEARPDGVVIATPQFTHRSLVELCLVRGVACFCEKPMAHTLDDARGIVAAATTHPSVPLAFGYQMAHNPLFNRAAQLLNSGTLGALKSYRASCRLSQVFSPKKGWTFTRDKAGGGVLINSGCHLLQVLATLFGRPAGATARGSGVHNEVEDTFGALVDYPGGLWGTIEVTWSVPGHDMQTGDIEVIGDRGTLEVNPERLRVWLAQAGDSLRQGWTEWRREEVEPRAPFSLSPDYCGDEFYLQMSDFIAAIREKRQPRVGAREAWLVQEMLDMLYRAAATRQWAAMPESAAP